MKRLPLLLIPLLLLSYLPQNIAQDTCNFVLLDARGWSYENKIAAVTLQGLINREKPTLYIVYSDAELSLVYKAFKRCTIRRFSGDVKDLLSNYKQYYRGAVVYDPKLLDTVNLATALASLDNLVVLSPRLADETHIQVVYDLRGKYKSKLEVYSEILKMLNKFNNSALAVLNPNVPNLRDFLVKHRIAVVYLSPLPSNPEERTLLEKILSKHSRRLVYGFFPGGGAGEKHGVDILSIHGKTLVVSPYAGSISFSEWFYNKVSINPRLCPQDISLKSNGIYATLIMSDGDNLGYLIHEMSKPERWQNPNRGNVPIGWSLNPWAVKLIPNVVAYYYETATQNDYFVSGVGGVGYIDPALAPPEALKELVNEVKPFVNKANLDIAYLFRPVDEKSIRVLSKIYKAFYITNTGISDHRFLGYTQINGKPVIYTVRITASTYRKTINEVLERVRVRPLLLALELDAWSFDMNKIMELSEYLKQRGITIVNPCQLSYLAEKLTIPWYEVIEHKNSINFEAGDCNVGFVYSRLSGDLLFITRLGGMVSINGRNLWPSRDLKCQITKSSDKYIIKFSDNSIEIVKRIRMEGHYIRIDTTIESSQPITYYDVLLDQLDTFVWPPHGSSYPYETKGPRYAYTPSKGIIQRTVGTDPFLICSRCNELLVLDNSFPYPRAIGIKVEGVSGSFIDAFSNGDSDKDGVGEYHAITLVTKSTGHLTYTVYMVPIDHGWAFRLPDADVETMISLAYPSFKSLLGETMFMQSLASQRNMITETITKTLTVTFTETRTKTITKRYAHTTTVTKTHTASITEYNRWKPTLITLILLMIVLMIILKRTK